MIPVSQADSIIGQHARDFGTETVPLAQAVGRVLRESILADRDFPPFDRVAMDGIAIAYDAYARGQRRFSIAGTVRAGEAPASLANPADCLEVMTGCVLPPGTDCVIRVEDLEVAAGAATVINGAKVKHGQNIHAQAMDNPLGATLLEPGCRLASPQIAVLATVGKTEVVVGRAPRVAVVATGDELVEVDQTPAPHQIRKSNVHAVVAGLPSTLATRVDAYHLQDDLEQIRRELGEILTTHDVVILSGGISMGKFDYIPGMLAELGVELQFHKVQQRPGKPFCFGQMANGATVFALPGNPVSTVTCFTRYVRPFIVRNMGAQVQSETAILAEPFDFAPNLTYFMPVRTRFDEQGRRLAERVVLTGSGDLSNLALSDGFIELSAEPSHFLAGTLAPYYHW